MEFHSDFTGKKLPLPAMKDSTEYLIALGANTGDRKANLTAALERMEAFGEIVEVSDWLENAPVGFHSEEQFLNGVCRFLTTLNPEQLLDELQRLERDLGRVRSDEPGYQSRTMDLDILTWSGGLYRSNRLEIPHPRMHERLFVLVPLCEIAPDEVHPVMRVRFVDLLKELTEN